MSITLLIGLGSLVAAMDGAGPSRALDRPEGAANVAVQVPGRFEMALAQDPPGSQTKAPKSKTANPGAKPAQRREADEYIDLKIRKVPLRQSASRSLVWAADGRSFYCIEVDTIHRFNLEDLRQLARWRPVNVQILDLSPSAEGLLMLCGNDPQEIWILDPETFAARNKITARDVGRIISAPSQSVAFGIKGENRGIGQETLLIFDLKKGTMVRELNTRDSQTPVSYQMATVSPDGKSLYTQYRDLTGGLRLQRFQINGTRLRYVGSSPASRSCMYHIGISADGSMVALPLGRDFEEPVQAGQAARRDSELFVLRTSNLSRPALTLRVPSDCHSFLEFDSRNGGFIASGHGLVLFDKTGRRRNAVPAGKPTTPVWAELLHPEGHTLLRAERDGLYVVSLPE
jgi:hypothetical protein